MCPSRTTESLVEMNSQALLDIQTPGGGGARLVRVSLTLSSPFSTMKLFTGLILCSLVLGVHSQWMSFFGEAYEGKADGGAMAFLGL